MNDDPNPCFNMVAEDHSGDEMKVHAIRENDEEFYDDLEFNRWSSEDHRGFRFKCKDLA